MFEEIVGTSPPLQRVLSKVTKVAPTDSTVLIGGRQGRERNSLPTPFTSAHNVQRVTIEDDRERHTDIPVPEIRAW
jgi:transcriptional regulator of aromatic amino acid metabolism